MLTIITTRILSRQYELLDERDQVLRELSELVKIKVDEATNGSVDVSLTNTFSSGVIVSGLESERLFATFSDNDVSKVDIQLGQYTSEVEAISSIGGGNLGGLLAFRKTLLEPTLREIDNLAKIFVFEVNDIHKKGLDLVPKHEMTFLLLILSLQYCRMIKFLMLIYPRKLLILN